MAGLIHFVPLSSISAAENLREFIRMCRDDLTVFGADLKWADWRWPGAAHFTKVGITPRGGKDDDRLDDGLVDFAKAYFRYQQGHKPTTAKLELTALRTIEVALLQMKGNACISGIDMSVLDEAASQCRRHYSAGVAYHAGRELMRLASFVTEKQLVSSSVGAWKSPIRKVSDITIQTGPKAKAIQDRKLPNEEAIAALSEIYCNDPKDAKDIFTTSVFVMLMCAPSRITEILELPADCEVEELCSEGKLRYGWRFFGGKGYEGDIKWIPTPMIPCAKEAVRRILAMTEESRVLARWVEENPTKAFRHANCPKVSDDSILTNFQICEFLGLSNPTAQLSKFSLSSLKFKKRDGADTLNGLWRYAMSRQPKGMPWLSKTKKIRYSNALFCMTQNFLRLDIEKSRVILWAPRLGSFNQDLSGRVAPARAIKSIFDRHGYSASDGQRLKMTSHQVRHLLNTLANRGGLPPALIAKWSGRADAKQNRVYNHMSEFEMVAAAEALDTSLTLFGPKGDVTQRVPISAQEFNLTERGPVHVTEFGVCVHDYIRSPCEKFRDCLNCQEQVCIKGEDERLQRLKVRLSETEKDFTQAKEDVANGYSGADRWYEHHEKTINRLRQLVAILESPDVPDGAQIKLRDGKDYTHLRRAIRTKAADALERNTPDASLLSGMTSLLGGSLG